MAILFSLLVIPFGLIQDSTLAFWLMTVIVASAMGVVTVVSVQLIVYIQLVSDKALLGRIMSLVMIVTTLAIPLGQVMYGSFAAAASTKMLLVLIIATSIVTILIAIFSIRIFKQMRVKHIFYKKSNPFILYFIIFFFRLITAVIGFSCYTKNKRMNF